ncbi:WD40/YVTN/BNR-like repeat-containing protein [Nanoarchaeota archaeon]
MKNENFGVRSSPINIKPKGPGMKMYLIMIAFISLIVLGGIWFVGQTFTGMAIHNINWSNFQGEYSNTVYSDGIRLSGDRGTYTSQIFDTGFDVVWDNITWSGSSGQVFVGIDIDGSVIKSLGTTWKYFDSGLTLPVAISALSNGTVIAVDMDNGVWSSVYGRDWVQINGDYNGLETQAAVMMGSDDKGTLFIFEGDEDVYASYDLGRSWKKLSDDFDGESQANVKGFAYLKDDLFVVTEDAQIFSSQDAINWTLLNSDFNSAATDGASDMVEKGGFLYILDRKAVWKSTDGINWINLIDNFNPNSTAVGVTLISDMSYLYAIDTQEDVYRSFFGSEWELIAKDVNGERGRILSLASYHQPSVKFQVRSSHDNSSWYPFIGEYGTKDSYYLTPSTLNVKPNRYFQYRVFFERIDPDYSPVLNSVNIGAKPAIQNAEPFMTLEQHSEGKQSTITCSAEDDHISSISISVNGDSLVHQHSCEVLKPRGICETSFTAGLGSYSTTCIATDNSSLSRELVQKLSVQGNATNITEITGTVGIYVAPTPTSASPTGASVSDSAKGALNGTLWMLILVGILGIAAFGQFVYPRIFPPVTPEPEISTEPSDSQLIKDLFPELDNHVSNIGPVSILGEQALPHSIITPTTFTHEPELVIAGPTTRLPYHIEFVGPVSISHPPVRIIGPTCPLPKKRVQVIGPVCREIHKSSLDVMLEKALEPEEVRKRRYIDDIRKVSRF